MSVSKEILNVIDGLAERCGVIIDWSKENVYPQVVDLCERFIHYKLTCQWIGFAMLIVLMVVAILCVTDIVRTHYEIAKEIEASDHSEDHRYYSNHYNWEGRNYWDRFRDRLAEHQVKGGYVWPTAIGILKLILSCLFILIGGLTLICLVDNIIQLYTVPELYFLDWIQDYM